MGDITMKLTNNFVLQEFVPKEIYEKFGDKSYMFIDERLPRLAQFFRDRFDRSVTINDWSYGGDSYNYSGFRQPDCPIGAPLSRHKMGKCIDVKIKGMTAKEIQKDIEFNFNRYKQFGLTAMEEGTPTWTHCSVEWTMTDKLVIIPKW